MCYSRILWTRTFWTSCPWGSIQTCTRLCPLISWRERHWRLNIWKVSRIFDLHCGIYICIIQLLYNCNVYVVIPSVNYFLSFFLFNTGMFFPANNQLEFCCHMLRGTIDPKEPPVYEYVKFIGNFKSLNNGRLHSNYFLSSGLCLLVVKLFYLSPVPNCDRNGFEGVIQRSLHSAYEDGVCLIATVRLAKPQFIKVIIINRYSTSHFSFHRLKHIQFHTSRFELINEFN